MAITSPGLTLAVEALFGNIKPVLDGVKKLGLTDFSAAAPGVNIAPGATIKVPVSAITAASAFNASSNNYLTGGTTTWATLTATHYLQGFDISGENVDEGINAQRIKQLFTARAGSGIAAAIQAALKTRLNAVTSSTGVSAPETVGNLLSLGDGVSWLDKATTTLAVNGTFLTTIKTLLAGINVAGSIDEIAAYLGYKDVVLVPGMTPKACIVPANAMGFVGRVPALIASYQESGVETDPDTGLSVGIVVANDQATNRVVANADMWFGVTSINAPADASTAGVISIA